MAEVSLEKKFLEHKKKAEQGDATAQCNLGYCYEMGKGTTKNYKSAFEWYKRSAEQGHVIGTYNLGICYFNGNGTEKNPTKALECFKYSAKQNYANAFYMIGRCYETGSGVNKNLKTALSYFKKAASLNSKKAIQRIPELTSKIQESKKPIRPVAIVALVWIAISVSYLTYSLIDGFGFLNSLSTFRTDFVKYVLVGGVLHTFLLVASFFGISLLAILPELIRGERNKKTTLKLVLIIVGVALVILIVFLLLSAFSEKTHFGKMFAAYVIEAFVSVYLFLIVADIRFTKLGYGLLIFVLGAIFLFYLSSYLRAIDRGFLSFLAGFPVGLLLALPIIYPIVWLVEKFGGGGGNYSSGSYSSTPNSSHSNTSYSSSSNSNNEKFQHVKTVVRSTPKGAPYKGIIGDRQDYDVEVVFTFRNAKGKEKTITKPYTYSGGDPNGCDFSTNDAEYIFGYVIREETK